MLCIKKVWYKCELRAWSRNVTQSTQITSPPSVLLSTAPQVSVPVLWKQEVIFEVLSVLRRSAMRCDWTFETILKTLANSGSWEQNRANVYRVSTALSDSVNEGSCGYVWMKFFFLVVPDPFPHFQPCGLALFFVGSKVYLTKFSSH